ncbi:hypothetical protein DFQ28_009873 [Apophysomyces sp. BC1034]|nr:hypothetical protein DFQ30_009433 [Apophysomyces sp. BC1015]KAG0181595.1 hypothetical protein DFQ29_007855 [Apophysomyces sp. BC1021]KAG0192200.1 hypothetical protein DFQ28_009873 [Apophysomyces sp. BC1034]
MGNTQSIGQVVEGGIEIYKTFKSQQDQQQHGQAGNFHPQQQHGQTGNFHPQQPHAPFADEHDDPNYSRLRALAHEEAEKRNQCYERSQAAYHNGDGAEAKELSTQGHYHDNQMKHYNSQAAELVYAQKNQNRPPTEIDLHGLFVHEASKKVEEALERCQRERHDHLVIIVGKGLHSPGNIAKLKPAILELVHKYQVSCEPNRPNPGCIYVEFGKGVGNLDWLDVFANKMANKECIIM